MRTSNPRNGAVAAGGSLLGAALLQSVTLASEDYRLPLLLSSVLLSSVLLLVGVVSLIRMFRVREWPWRVAATVGLVLAMLLIADIVRRAPFLF